MALSHLQVRLRELTKIVFVRDIKQLCHSYQLSPSYQASLLIFDKGSIVTMTMLLFLYVSNDMWKYNN